jgi:hypothetical protein
MPLKSSQILALLQEKRADFERFDYTAQQAFQKYRRALAKASQQTQPVISDHLRDCAPSDRGAEPLESLENDGNWVKSFGITWQSREDSYAWVRDRLTDIATFAVDGSQIYPGKDISIPIALIQIGWFENFHSADSRYEKDIDIDVMTPADLKANSSGDMLNQQVNMRRFQMEVERLIQYMEDRAGDRTCLAFFDGSLVVSFADTFDPATRDFYVKSVVKLLQASKHYQVPVVGYIDTSYARDLTVMLQRVYDLPDAPSIHDAPLLGTFMQWGDRTPLFSCRRSGVLQDYPTAIANQISFTYLKAHDGLPIRLELPQWIYEAGRLEQILDWVRGEVIIGGGYPYVIETADQTAVLKAEDSQLFFRLLQDWAKSEDLTLRLSRKMVSKARRR